MKRRRQSTDVSRGDASRSQRAETAQTVEKGLVVCLDGTRFVSGIQPSERSGSLCLGGEAGKQETRQEAAVSIGRGMKARTSTEEERRVESGQFEGRPGIRTDKREEHSLGLGHDVSEALSLSGEKSGLKVRTEGPPMFVNLEHQS